MNLHPDCNFVNFRTPENLPVRAAEPIPAARAPVVSTVSSDRSATRPLSHQTAQPPDRSASRSLGQQTTMRASSRKRGFKPCSPVKLRPLLLPLLLRAQLPPAASQSPDLIVALRVHRDLNFPGACAFRQFPCEGTTHGHLTTIIPRSALRDSAGRGTADGTR